MDLRYRRDCCTAQSLSHIWGIKAWDLPTLRDVLWKPQPSFPNRPYRQSHDGNIAYSSNPTPAVRTHAHRRRHCYFSLVSPPLLLFPLYSVAPSRSCGSDLAEADSGTFEYSAQGWAGLGWVSGRDPLSKPRGREKSTAAGNSTGISDGGQKTVA